MTINLTRTPGSTLSLSRSTCARDRTEVDFRGDGHGCVLLLPAPSCPAGRAVVLGSVPELVDGRKAAVVAADAAFWARGDFLGDGCEQVSCLTHIPGNTHANALADMFRYVP